LHIWTCGQGLTRGSIFFQKMGKEYTKIFIYKSMGEIWFCLTGFDDTY
jgi:hypothetical protein